MIAWEPQVGERVVVRGGRANRFATIVGRTPRGKYILVAVAKRSDAPHPTVTYTAWRDHILEPAIVIERTLP